MSNALSRLEIGIVGGNPGIVLMQTADEFDIITQPGYISNSYAGTKVEPTDVIIAVYGALSRKQLLSPNFNSGGIITLSSIIFDSLVAGNNIAIDLNSLPGSAVFSTTGSDNLITTYTLLNDINLGGGASVIIAAPASPASNYIITEMRIGGPTGGGAGGDRNISITSGTIVWSVIPSATLLAMSNLRWGSAGFPAPPTVNWVNTPTGIGANLVATYSGGTADYASLSIRISVTWQKIA